MANLFKEEGDEVEEDPEWRFVQQVVAAQPVPVVQRQEVPEEEEAVDMGNLFGDDDDY